MTRGTEAPQPDDVVSKQRGKCNTTQRPASMASKRSKSHFWGIPGVKERPKGSYEACWGK